MPSSLGPSIRAYKGSGNPGGSRSYQGRDNPGQATTSRRPGIGRFFGGSGSGPSQGAFPFSSAENQRISAIDLKWSKGEEERVKQKEMDHGGSRPSVLIVRRRPIIGLHDHK